MKMLLAQATAVSCEIPPPKPSLDSLNEPAQSVRVNSNARLVFLVLIVSLCTSSLLSAPNPDWPAWRGPTGDGLATPGQKPPVQWSETEAVLWKMPIPGRGHGSPTVVGDAIYLATADRDKKSQSVLCLQRQTGKLIWQTEVHSGGADPGKHANSSAASSTVACNRDQLFINFLNGGAVHTTALDLQGKVLWQRKICDYVTHQGFASSPIVHESLVLVSADHRGGGVIVGLNRKTGEVVWSVPRPKLPNYTSPSILKAAGRTQMVMAGCNLMTSLDPLTGKKLWEINGSTEECVGSAVTDGVRVFAGGGYPKNHTMAVAADGSGTVVWQNNSRVYVPSMIAKGGHLYAVLDAGVAVCWKSETGEELWKERLGGDFFASPVMVDDRIYASNVGGKTFVFEATPQSFKLLAQNQLGNEAYASPVICGSRVYLRVAQKGETRQEFLYCVGNEGAPSKP
jgi:outer membrane protein assembly factor BamB